MTKSKSRTYGTGSKARTWQSRKQPKEFDVVKFGKLILIFWYKTGLLIYKFMGLCVKQYRLYLTKRDLKRYKKLQLRYRSSKKDVQYARELDTIESGKYSDKIYHELCDAALSRYVDRQLLLLSSKKDVN